MREGSLFGSFLLVDRTPPSALFLVRGNPPCLGHVGARWYYVVRWCCSLVVKVWYEVVGLSIRARDSGSRGWCRSRGHSRLVVTVEVVEEYL